MNPPNQIKLTSVSSIVDTLSYVEQFYGSTVLIKLGGSILHNEELIQSLCDDLKLLKGAGIKIVLVHGGSKAINQALLIHNIESEFIDGLRVTSKEAMKIIEMVLCGHVNSVLVRKLNSIGISAIGLSGADNSMLRCEYFSSKHGCVGTIKSVNTDPIINVLSQQGMRFSAIPVIAPVGVDYQGNPLNINADWAAYAIGAALQVDKLIYLTDQDGIYDKSGKVISELSEQVLQSMIEDHTVTGGMLAKVNAILAALRSGMNDIHILNGQRRHSLIEELFTVHGIGTVCKKSLCFNEVH